MKEFMEWFLNNLTQKIRPLLSSEGEFSFYNKIKRRTDIWVILNLPYTKKKLYSALEKGCKKSGVKRIEIHSIRHSNITLLENEIGSATTKAISSRCGHTNTKMTLHYAHIYEGTDQKIANELDEMMKERKNNKCQQKTTIENSVSEA